MIANHRAVSAQGVASMPALLRTDRREQDPAALFAAHHAAVYRTAYRITGQAEDAEDVLQTVFLQVLRFAERDELANPGAYLRRLAINTALNLVRQRRRRPTETLAPEDPPSEPPGEASADRAARRGMLSTQPTIDPGAQELRDGLRDALAQLSPRAAEIFALRYFEDYTNRQIAELLKTSESSIGVTLHRARQRLRQALAPLVMS